MTDTRFETVVEDAEGLLRAVDVDELGDIETLLMFFFARPVGLTEVWDDESLTPSLEVVMRGTDEVIGTVYDFPLSIIELTRSCAETAKELGAYTSDGAAAEEAPDLSAMGDRAMIAALQRALGNVRLFNMLGEDV